MSYSACADDHICCSTLNCARCMWSSIYSNRGCSVLRTHGGSNSQVQTTEIYNSKRCVCLRAGFCCRKWGHSCCNIVCLLLWRIGRIYYILFSRWPRFQCTICCHYTCCVCDLICWIRGGIKCDCRCGLLVWFATFGGDVEAVVNVLYVVDTSAISVITAEEVSIRRARSVDVVHKIHLMYIIVITIENIFPFLLIIIFQVISQWLFLNVLNNLLHYV